MRKDIVNSTLYGLGKRAYKVNSEKCDPMGDPLFERYIQENMDIPVIIAMKSYVKGWQEMHDEAERKEKVVKIDDYLPKQ